MIGYRDRVKVDRQRIANCSGGSEALREIEIYATPGNFSTQFSLWGLMISKSEFRGEVDVDDQRRRGEKERNLISSRFEIYLSGSV